jgi:hypothetical protein
MKLAVFLGALIATASATPAPPVHREDLIGTWKDLSCAPYDGTYEFHADGVFFWHCEDVVDGGKWTFQPLNKIELLSYGDWGEKPAITKASVHHSLRIEAFAKHRMIVRLLPGGAKSELLKQ